jgi:murein DD-endopeptidase MepM/ murein hydrolase activator NlpD
MRPRAHWHPGALRNPVLTPSRLSLGISKVLDALARHPKRITTSLAVLLLGTGVTAFGVAPLAPDAADLPVRQIVEVVEALPAAEQTLALQDYQFSLYRTELTRSTDTADSLLKRLNIDDSAAAAFMRTDAIARSQLLGRPGRNVTAEASESQQLLKLTMRWPSDDEGRFSRLVIERVGNGFASRVEGGTYTSSMRLASGTIKSSLFAATDEANIPDAVAVQVADIFSGDIDFNALRRGDRFSLVYETLEADGEPLRTGKVLSAEFVSNGKPHQAMWFSESETPAQSDMPVAIKGKGAYYTLDGESLRKAYLASPMEFSRISSGFKMRFHPVLKTWRAHLGVDYAAPTGTSVRTVGDGVVSFAGVQSGFGNVVFIEHQQGHTTVYAHLSRIGVERGQRVTQGQHIGAVGSTGWATGPHLHFEFRVNGDHQDPMKIARQSTSVPLAASAVPLFRERASLMRQKLLAAVSVNQSVAQ